MKAPVIEPGNNTENGDELNVSQQQADRQFNGIADAEKNGTAGDLNNTDESAKQNSSGLSSAWNTNVGNNTAAGPKKNFQFGKLLKKSSPSLGIVGTLGIGGFILLALTSPSLLIVQLKETMVGRFNTQLSSMEARTNKLIYTKINAATSGYCSEKLTIRCKFSSMTQRQVDKLKAAGIEITPKKVGSVTGRVTPGKMTFKGQEITAANFTTIAGRDPSFRNALKQAYNPKYAGFTGKAWSAVATKFGLSKQKIELDADVEPDAAMAKINDIAKEGFDEAADGKIRIEVGKEKYPGCGTTPECLWSDEEYKAAEAAKAKVASAGDSASNDVRNSLSGLSSNVVWSFAKITGPLDTACTVYGGLNAISYAGKAIRAAQLMRYALIFMNVADTIKAGDSPKPGDVALLGTVLTTTVKSKDDASVTAIGSATDSFGYKYAAYGDSSAPKKSMNIANRFISGGGFVGDMSAVSDSILSTLGGKSNAKATCGVLANPLVQGASLVVGVAALLIPGVNVGKVISGDVIGGLYGVIVMNILPALLGDIIAGTVTKDIVGEEAGNAITSGSGALMSDQLAAQNGNAPMSKQDAIAYNNMQTEVNNRYIADELENTSPFDANNPNSFIGSIAAALIPLRSSSNPLTTLGSLFLTSFGKIIPQTSAETTAEYAKTLDVCQDLDVKDAGYAADPFCNIIRGIPPKYLDKDPLTVAEELIATEYIDSETEEPTQRYTDFINKCMTSEQPLGYANVEAGFSVADAQECIINDSNANLYLHYMDKQIEADLSLEDGSA